MRKFFFTILKDVEKSAVLREKYYFLIFYITREIRTMERLFEISNYIIPKKNCEITQFLTLSIHTFLVTNFKKSLHSSDLPSNIKN